MGEHLLPFLSRKHKESVAQRKRASPRGEAGTSGFPCVSDSDRRVPAELGQESQASSCLRKGTPLARWPWEAGNGREWPSGAQASGGANLASTAASARGTPVGF